MILRTRAFRYVGLSYLESGRAVLTLIVLHHDDVRLRPANELGSFAQGGLYGRDADTGDVEDCI